MNENIERFYQCKWGVFNHYLFGIQNSTKSPNSHGRETDWDTCVKELDVEKLAVNLHDMGAGYYFITIMQGRKYMIAPNKMFDKICGTKPGEACSTRDLIEDLYQALAKYGIDLYLYFTGDGPYKDIPEGKQFGLIEPREKAITESFVQKWAAVLEEYSIRYGNKVKGWWIDGGFKDAFGYTDELLSYYYIACKKGNPNALIAFNDGIKNELVVNYKDEDFTCGEREDFVLIPTQRFYGKAQAHILAPLGTGDCGIGPYWGSNGIKNSKEYIADYVRRVNTAGGVLTIDIALFRDGSFDKEQAETLKYVGKHV